MKRALRFRMHLILDDEHNAVPVDLMTWARWLEKDHSQRVVAQTKLANDIVLVSTVFLGIDHNFSEEGPPILFETMVFGMLEDDEMAESYCWRYSSWDDAETGHAMAVKKTEALLAIAAVKKDVDHDC